MIEIVEKAMRIDPNRKGGCLTGTNTSNAAIKSSKTMYYNIRVNSADLLFITK